jgi:hypothetical protein
MYGDCISPAGCFQSCVVNMGDVQDSSGINAERNVMNDYKNIKGMQTYYAVDLAGAGINELQLDYKRDLTSETPTGSTSQNNQDVNLHLYAEVPKVISVQDNRYIVAYA